MPADIIGTTVIDEDETGARPSSSARADLREHRPGRRDQPRDAEDAERAARGHAGAPGHGGEDDLPLDEPFFVLATQNPLERRARTRCPRRSSTASSSSCTCRSRPRRAAPDPRSHDRLRDADDHARARRMASSRCRSSCAPCPSRGTCRTTRCGYCRPRTPTAQAEKGWSGLDSVRASSSSAPRLAAPRRSPRLEDPSALRGALRRVDRRRQGGGATLAPSSRAAQLRRRGGGDQDGRHPPRDHQAPPRDRELRSRLSPGTT
jgi:hypothetical protein